MLSVEESEHVHALRSLSSANHLVDESVALSSTWYSWPDLIGGFIEIVVQCDGVIQAGAARLFSGLNYKYSTQHKSNYNIQLCFNPDSRFQRSVAKPIL